MSADPNRMNGTVLHHKLAVHLGEIACMFRGAPKLTLVVRNPVFGDADVVIGDDDPEEAIAAIRRMHELNDGASDV